MKFLKDRLQKDQGTLPTNPLCHGNFPIMVLGQSVPKELMLLDTLTVSKGVLAKHSISIVDDLKAEFLKARFKEEFAERGVVEVALDDFLPPESVDFEDEYWFDPVSCLELVQTLQSLTPKNKDTEMNSESLSGEIYQALMVYVSEVFKATDSEAGHRNVTLVTQREFLETISCRRILRWLSIEANTEARHTIHSALSTVTGFSDDEGPERFMEAYSEALMQVTWFLPYALRVNSFMSQFSLARDKLKARQGQVIFRIPGHGQSTNQDKGLYLSYVLYLVTETINDNLMANLSSDSHELASPTPRRTTPVYMSREVVSHSLMHYQGLSVVAMQGRTSGYKFAFEMGEPASQLKEGNKGLEALIANTMYTIALTKGALDQLQLYRDVEIAREAFPEACDQVLVYSLKTNVMEKQNLSGPC